MLLVLDFIPHVIDASRWYNANIEVGRSLAQVIVPPIGGVILAQEFPILERNEVGRVGPDGDENAHHLDAVVPGALFYRPTDP